MYSSYLLNDYQTGNCKGEKPGIEMKEGGHPIFAFDISNFSQKTLLSNKRTWLFPANLLVRRSGVMARA